MCRLFYGQLVPVSLYQILIQISLTSISIALCHRVSVSKLMDCLIKGKWYYLPSHRTKGLSK